MQLPNKELLKIKPIYDHEKAIEIALRTWYPLGHPLHLDPHHPLGKLLGEWGELLDDYMKSLYKPGYVFEPESELGDIWYYLRILCYQKKHAPVNSLVAQKKQDDIDYLMAVAMRELCTAFIGYNNYDVYVLNLVYSVSLKICKRYGLTLDQLTESNWEKLKPGSVRGDEWAKAR